MQAKKDPSWHSVALWLTETVGLEFWSLCQKIIIVASGKNVNQTIRGLFKALHVGHLSAPDLPVPGTGCNVFTCLRGTFTCPEQVDRRWFRTLPYKPCMSKGMCLQVLELLWSSACVCEHVFWLRSSVAHTLDKRHRDIALPCLSKLNYSRLLQIQWSCGCSLHHKILCDCLMVVSAVVRNKTSERVWPYKIAELEP